MMAYRRLQSVDFVGCWKSIWLSGLVAFLLRAWAESKIRSNPDGGFRMVAVAWMLHVLRQPTHVRLAVTQV